MSVRVTGLDSVTNALGRLPSKILDDTRLILQEGGKDMVRDAKAFRKLPKKSLGNATDRSIEATVDNLVLKFWINPAGVTTTKGFNIAWGQNDGTYSDYKRGSISPQCDNVGGTRKGLSHQDFMGRAWKKNIKELRKQLKEATGRAWRSSIRSGTSKTNTQGR
jgi:hypothetical protein